MLASRATVGRKDLRVTILAVFLVIILGASGCSNRLPLDGPPDRTTTTSALSTPSPNIGATMGEAPIGPEPSEDDADPVFFEVEVWGRGRLHLDSTDDGLQLRAYPTGHLGYEPTVRSTGEALLLTGSRDVLRSTDWRDWAVVQQHPLTLDPVLAWDPIRQQAVKADLDASFSCAYVSTAGDAAGQWSAQRPACSATMDYLKVAAGPKGPDPNPLATSSVTYLCHNVAPPANPCLVSHDGAATFLPMLASVPAVLCGGITSYPAVRGDGLVVLPVAGLSCLGPSFLFSRDSGLTWKPMADPVDQMRGSGPGHLGSMTSIDFDGPRLVAAWESERGLTIAWSDDLAAWSPLYTVRVPGVKMFFSAMQAGNGTVALAFLGETGGEWSLYAGALRLDEKPSGSLLRLADPVQRGDVCVGSTCLAGRNMGDFITSTTHQGEFVAAFTDGCVKCGPGQSKDGQLSLARVQGARL